MTARDAEIEQRIGHNVDDLIANGPRLSLGRSTWIAVRSNRGWVMRGGLGAFGNGRMWCPERIAAMVHADGSRTAPDYEDPTYADAPVNPEALDDFGTWVTDDGETDNEAYR